MADAKLTMTGKPNEEIEVEVSEKGGGIRIDVGEHSVYVSIDHHDYDSNDLSVYVSKGRERLAQLSVPRVEVCFGCLRERPLNELLECEECWNPIRGPWETPEG